MLNLITLLADTSLGTVDPIGGYDPSANGGATQIENIFTNIFGFLTIIGGLMFLIYFTIGGLTWITSGGEPEKVQKAQKTMTSAAIGLIIIVVSYSVIWIVSKVLGFEILSPAAELNEFLGGGGN